MELRELTDRVDYVSAGYADQFGVTRTPDWMLLKLTEEVGELVQAHLDASGQGRDRGREGADRQAAIADELADVVSMCLVYARHAGVEVEDAITQKWFRYEAGHRERGFVR